MIVRLRQWAVRWAFRRRQRVITRQYDALSIHGKAKVLVRAIGQDKELRKELRRALDRRDPKA